MYQFIFDQLQDANFLLIINFQTNPYMKSELQKLKGKSIKTNVGEITFKQFIRLQTSQFDQIYFKTNYKDSICKLYDLKQSISIERYNNQVQQYKPVIIPILYPNVHYEIFKYKGKQYGMMLYFELAKFQPLVISMTSISYIQLLKLTLDLLTLIHHMKNQSSIYYNIRPYNIFKGINQHALIDCQYVQPQGHIKQCLKGVVEKDWHYWSPELLDPYSKDKIDYNVDLFALGCLLYEIKTSQYPFQSKLAQMHLNYTKLENPANNIIIDIMGQCLSNYETRSLIDISKYINMINKILEDEGSPPKKSKTIIRKGSNTGIFDNFTTAFSKLVNDTQGYFLNYTEDNDKDPQEKYLENLLTKIYKANDKIQKLRGVAEKYLNTIKNKPFSMVKFCLLIGNIFRKGPKGVYKEFKDLIKEMVNESHQSEQYYLLIDLIQCKFNIHKKVKKCMAGNFYISEISEFKSLQIKDFGNLVVYLEKLTGALKKLTSDLKNCAFSVPIINFICDEIYDITSMLIMSIVALRKDNDLQLRNDNLQQLLPIEKMLNSCLKKISYLSNFISAHAIYSIENDYIVYQEEINLLFNPYHSSLQHFYKSLRGYKGLSLPHNYQQIYTQPQKPVQKSSPHKQSQNHEQKSYFFSGQQYESDEEEHEVKGLNNEYYGLNINTNVVKNHVKQQKPTILQQVKKSDTMSQSKSNPNNKTYLVTKKSTPSSVSFQDFINIAKQPQEKQKTKKQNEFSMFFNDLKGHKSPPAKQKQGKNFSYVGDSPRKNMNFEEFSNIGIKKTHDKKENNNKTLLDFDFNELSKMNSPPKFDNNPFIDQTQHNKSNTSATSLLNFQNFDKISKPREIHSIPSFPPPTPPLPPVPETSPYVQQILKSLKLKELKDLLLKNQKFILTFQELTFIKVIGSGSAGEVSSGRYKGESVAIKKVKFRQNPNALKEFERELVTYIKINQNSNLVSLIGLAESNGDFYLVTQFCQHGSLFDLLHRRPDIEFTWKERLKFAIQIAEGVLFLHSMKPVIIHRDLKSLNVFVARGQNNSFTMKVADFGLSRSPEAQMMTTQLGTIHWMAPQLLQGKQYSIKVDVYSYGVLLWEIISRKTPYNNLKNPMAILKYVAIDKMRPDLSQIPAECPKQLIDITQKCWQHDPGKRPSFSAILSQLKMITL